MVKEEINKIDSWSIDSVTDGLQTLKKMHPSDMVLRSFLSNNYFSINKRFFDSDRILDIGCLYANNLVPFAEFGSNLYGVEINRQMVKLAQQSALNLGIEIEVKQGMNRSLPYPNEYFDLVLSMNTIHYEENRDALLDALKEIKRVGNEGCHYFFVTAGQNHCFHQTAIRLHVNQYQLNVKDFRDGQIMSYFDNKDHFETTLSLFFDKVEVATITESWPKNTYEFYVAKCIK